MEYLQPKAETGPLVIQNVRLYSYLDIQLMFEDLVKLWNIHFFKLVGVESVFQIDKKEQICLCCFSSSFYMYSTW